MKKRRVRSIKDFIFPHEGNGYKPLALTVGGVAVALALVVLVQSVYLLGSHFALSNPNFLASVLPSVVTALTNEDRAANNLAVLTPDDLLTQAAQLKAEDMAEKGYFSHVSPEGKTPWYWLDQVHYSYSYAGENLAVDFTDSKEVEEAWMASPTHRANIVKPQYTRIGIGVAQGTYEGKETTFVVQFFATPKSVAVRQEEKVAPVEVVQNTQVLGAATEPVVLPVAVNESVAKVVASPMSTTTYVLSAIAGLFLILLLIAIVVHVRIQFIEVIVGGLLVISAALIFMGWNAIQPSVQVTPTVTSPAAVEPK